MRQKWPVLLISFERLTRTMEKVMKTGVGLWIDHRKAVIVFVAGKDTEIKVISANIEKHHRQSGVVMPADDVRQRE